MFQMEMMPGNRINKTDVMLYTISAVVGVSIVFANYYLSMESAQVNQIDGYMQKILTRMDMVSGQLGAWGAIDIRKELGR